MPKAPQSLEPLPHGARRDLGRCERKAGGGGAVAAPPNPFGAPFAAPEHPILEVSLSRRRFRCFRNPAARASLPAWEGVYRFVRASIRKPPRAPLFVPLTPALGGGCVSGEIRSAPKTA